jgi:hypothetical protein
MDYAAWEEFYVLGEAFDFGNLLRLLVAIVDWTSHRRVLSYEWN